MKCQNRNLKEVKDLIDAFGEVFTAQILEEYPDDKVPTVEEIDKKYPNKRIAKQEKVLTNQNIISELNNNSKYSNLIFDFDGTLVDTNSAIRKYTGMTPSKYYSQEQPDDVTKRLTEVSELTSLGSELLSRIKNGSIDPKKVKIITASSARRESIAEKLGIPVENVIIVTDNKTRSEYNLPVKQDVGKDKASIINTMNGINLFIDDKDSTINAVSKVKNTNSIKFTEDFRNKEEIVKENTFERQYTILKRQINRLEKELKSIKDKTSLEYKTKDDELKTKKQRLEDANIENNKEAYIELGIEKLFDVEQMLVHLPKSFDKYTIDHIIEAMELLDVFDDNLLPELAERSKRLRNQLFPYIEKYLLDGSIAKFNNSGVEITKNTLDKEDKDIRWSSSMFGSLSDIINTIGRTIGSLIKSAQNTASVQNKKLEHEIQKEIDLLKVWGKANNMSLEQVYDLFVQVDEQQNGVDKLVLARKYLKNGKENENYKLIQKTPELKHFYSFYRETLKKIEANLPYKLGMDYVLNIKKEKGIKESLKDVIPVKDNLFSDFVANEDLISDIVPEMYRKNVPASEKSRDLGSGLLKLGAYANNHNQLSKALSEARLLQQMLLYKTDSKGNVVERRYKKSTSDKEGVLGKDTNIYKMTNAFIDMQLKGKMHKDEHRSIKISTIKDKHGNVVGYKEVPVEEVVDKFLRWNSLLRIGLSPITAITNVFFGDISNIIEGFGGLHYTSKELRQATNVFFKQLDYTSDKKESDLYKWLEKLNPLQELADYEIGEGLKAEPKKLTKEKALEMMYSMQKKGELYLQSRTMLAVLINEGYMTPDGKTTKEGEALTENELNKLSDKIQRLNQLIHGRYSQRERGAIMQSVWARAALQFRQWIPSAIEQRFGDKKFDHRLQVEIEGRYRTFGAKVFKASSIQEAFENMFIPLINSKALLDKGQMTKTEIYNMRKNMLEMVLLLTTTLLIAGLKGDDDDKEWKKNPWVKAGLTTLNRISGDINYFYNPSNAANIMSNAVPMSKLIKDIIKVGYTLPHAFYLGEYEIKKGSRKGLNDFYFKNLPNIIPGFAPGSQIQKIINSTDILTELN